MYVLYCVSFFFFKQKTAYEMRISYWSSDVCSSDRHVFMATANLPVGTVIDAPAVDLPAFASRYPNLAGADLSAEVISCTDEFFAAAQRMLQQIGSASCRARVCH